MRVRIVCELISFRDLYLNDEFLARGLAAKPAHSISLAYASYFGDLPEKVTDQVVPHIFEAELMVVRKRSHDMGMWQLHALSSVLKMPVFSAYPSGRGHNVRPDLHRILLPREEAAVHSTPFTILWTSTHGDKEPPITWCPNHFVACLPPGMLEI